MPSSSDERYRVVRIFPDFGDSSIWFAQAYPFDYAESGISAQLRAEFETWEQFFYANVGYGTASTDAARREHDKEGRRLANALAHEIGARFAVDVIPASLGKSKPRFVGDATPTNPVAAEAFARVSDESLADDIDLETRKAEIEAQVGGFSLIAPPPQRGIRGFLQRRSYRRYLRRREP